MNKVVLSIQVYTNQIDLTYLFQDYPVIQVRMIN